MSRRVVSHAVRTCLHRPIGVLSLVAHNLAKHWERLSLVGPFVGVYVAALLGGLALHLLVVLPAIFALLARRNPYRYLLNAAPAMLAALGSSSSAASLPVTLRCAIEENGALLQSHVSTTLVCTCAYVARSPAAPMEGISTGVSAPVANFVCSLGSTINMDGTAVGYPCAVTFIALVQARPLLVV